jgi:hypothetical protein
MNADTKALGALRYFCVTYRDARHPASEPPFFFVCLAEDTAHAEEQCLDAEPTAVMLEVR